MLVSIIIPTYNEAADIRQTLDALLALTYEPKEIIVVDASQDETPQIVRNYPSDKVHLIIQSHGKGRAAARNEGIWQARGDIIIILNADVQLPADFIQKILPHYQHGADYVLVESLVSNLEHPIPRYIQAMHEAFYPPQPEIEAQMNWTEGFSCKREAAIAVGGIPEGEGTPLLAGEDGWFGEKLAAANYRKIFDRTIVVTHLMPTNLNIFWEQRAGRSEGVTQIWRMQSQWNLERIKMAVIKHSLLGSLALLIPIPSVRRAWWLTSYSMKGVADFAAFMVIDWLASAANIWGLIRGLRALQKINSD